MISRQHSSSHGDTRSCPPRPAPSARPSSAPSREPAECAAVSATGDDDRQPTVDEMLRGSDWEARLAEARAKRRAALARKSARDARHPDPHPDVGSGRPCAASGGNGGTQADVGEALIPMPAPTDDGQGPAPIETAAGNRGAEGRARRTRSLPRAGLGLAAGILIGLAVVPTVEVLASMRADGEDAVGTETSAARGPDVWMPPSSPLRGTPITAIVPTSARLGTAWGSTDETHAATSGIDLTPPETVRWTLPQIEAPITPEPPSGIRTEPAIPSGCVALDGTEFCGIRVALVVGPTVPDDRVRVAAAPLADRGVSIEPTRRTSLAPPGRTVRYFHDRDAASARAVADLLGAAVVALPAYRPRPAPGVIEVVVGVP